MPRIAINDDQYDNWGTWANHRFTDLDELLVWVKIALADGNRADYSTIRFLRDGIIPWLIRRIQELEAPAPDLGKVYDNEKI